MLKNRLLFAFGFLNLPGKKKVSEYKLVQMKFSIVFASFLLANLIGIQEITAQSDFELMEAEIINIQKDIVAKLTGKTPIKGKKNISSRFTPGERRLTADYITDLIKGLDIKPQKQSYDVQDNRGSTFSGTNIYAEIPATTDSDEYVILCTHYDSSENSPGAVHNATGVALTYFVGKQLLSLNYRTKNVMLVFFDQQEASMMGNRMFVDKLQKENYRVHSMHRTDYIGWDNDEDRAIEIFSSSLGLESKYRIESFVPLFKRNVSSPESAVFSSFKFDNITVTAELKNGDNSPFIHQKGDEYNTVNFKYLASTTEIVFRVLQSLLEE